MAVNDVRVPELTDGVVTLRAHRPGDVDAMVEMARDEEAVRWTSIPSPYDAGDARRYALDIVPAGWFRGDHRGWAVVASDDDGTERFAGNVDVRGRAVADVGFVLHPWARGRGVMARAVRLAVQWAFTHDDVEIVHWRAHVGNTASLRVAWATGFHLDGTTLGLLHERGRLIDAWTGHLHFGETMAPRAPWLDVPVLDGEGVRLRPPAERDVPRLVESTTDPATRQFLAMLGLPGDAAAARAYVTRVPWGAATGSSVLWCVADPVSDDLLAVVSLVHLGGIDPTSGEVGYWAHPGARGRGVVTAAASLAVAHALRPTADGGLGLRRLELLAAASNAASNAVAARLGFTRTGVDRAAEPLGDGSHDDLVRWDLLG